MRERERERESKIYTVSSYIGHHCPSLMGPFTDLLLLVVYMCEIHVQLVLGSISKGHKPLQQLLHRGIECRAFSLPLY